MIKNHLKSLMEKSLNFAPTDCQSELMTGLSEFITSEKNNCIFLIKGYAGTGKTSMINVLVKILRYLKIKTVLMAPTGRAAKVMAGYTNMPAYTIHKTIYRQKSTEDGMGKFVLDKNLFKNTWFIVDEASMISNMNIENSVFGSGRLLDDLIEYVYHRERCRLVLVGDIAQLPPVGTNISPALKANRLQGYGFEIKEYNLTKVVRQATESGILKCATYIREKIEKGDSSGFFKIETNDDVIRVPGDELIELITTCYDRYGLSDTIIVTRSNKRANLFNKGIRGSVLYRENEIEKGDLLMVVKNNYFWAGKDDGIDFIANGDIAEIVSIYKYEELYGFRFADVCLRFVDYENLEIDCKIFLDTLTIDTAAFTKEKYRELFYAVSEDYLDIKNKKNRWKKIKGNPHFNALQVKYAYAITCHKAQGGQWKAVFVDHGYLTEQMLNQEYYRWLYTAFTRPIEKLFLVNFSKYFFNDLLDF